MYQIHTRYADHSAAKVLLDAQAVVLDLSQFRSVVSSCVVDIDTVDIDTPPPSPIDVKHSIN